MILFMVILVRVTGPLGILWKHKMRYLSRSNSPWNHLTCLDIPTALLVEMETSIT